MLFRSVLENKRKEERRIREERKSGDRKRKQIKTEGKQKQTSDVATRVPVTPQGEGNSSLPDLRKENESQ